MHTYSSRHSADICHVLLALLCVMPYQELSDSNSKPKTPKENFLPSSVDRQPTSNLKTVPLNEHKPKHPQTPSAPYEANGFEDLPLSSEHLRRFLAVGSEFDSKLVNNCSKNCLHLEWCLVLEEELTKIKQELTETKMINSSVNSELATLRALVSGVQITRGGSLNASSQVKGSHDELSTEVDSCTVIFNGVLLSSKCDEHTFLTFKLQTLAATALLYHAYCEMNAVVLSLDNRIFCGS